MLQIIPAVAKPLPCKWAVLQSACVHEHTRGRGRLQQAKRLVCASLTAIIASGDILTPSSTPLPLVPCPGPWPQLARPNDGTWSSGQGTDVLCPARVSPGLAEGPGVWPSLFSSMPGRWTQKEWLRHPSHATRTSGVLGSRAAGAEQRGCWRETLWWHPWAWFLLFLLTPTLPGPWSPTVHFVCHLQTPPLAPGASTAAPPLPLGTASSPLGGG